MNICKNKELADLALNTILKELLLELSLTNDTNNVYRILLEAITRYSCCPISAIVHYNRNLKRMELKGSIGISNKYLIASFDIYEMNSEISKHLLESDSLLELTLVSELKYINKFLNEKIKCAIFFPVITKEKPGGFVFIAYRNRSNFTKHCKIIIQFMINHAVLCIKRIENFAYIPSLQKSLDMYLRKCPDIVIECNRNGIIQEASEGACEKLKYKKENMLNTHVSKIYWKKNIARDIVKIMLQNKGMIINYKTSLCTSDGNELPVILSGFGIFNENNEIIRTVGFSKDLSEIETHLDDYFHYIDKRETEIEQNNIVNLSQIAMMFVHDSRNSLQDINSYLTSIIEYIPENLRNDYAINKMIKELTETTDRLKGYFNHLYTKSKLKIDYFKKQNIFEILFDVIELFDYRMTKKKIKHGIYYNKKKINKNTYDDILVLCDKYQIEQVFMNLFINSLYSIDKKYETKRGFFDPEIRIDIAMSDNNIIISFFDNGLGIKDEDKLKIYDPYFTTKPETEGSGYGLTLSKYIIINHKGTIQEESLWGEYCSFCITLPCN